MFVCYCIISVIRYGRLIDFVLNFEKKIDFEDFFESLLNLLELCGDIII